MTFFIFAGPTISAADIGTRIDAVVLPPVSMGDIYRCSRTRPSAIGIIDGYFGGIPSVWHKEILWAIDQGIAVFGAASMGALRAAELHKFGMRGIGSIFEAFRDGTLEDDDEVAIEHGPAEIGYLPLSEPMVNIRATLEHAVQEGAIGRQVSEALSAIAKEFFYPGRTWRALAERALIDGVDKEQLKALEAWMPQGRVDQKRLDAVAMLDAMEAYRREGCRPQAANFHLEWTTMWADVLRDIEASDLEGGAAAIIDELRQDPERFRTVRRNATARLFARRGGTERQVSSDARKTMRAATTRFRSERKLFTQAAFDRWLINNELDGVAFEEMIEVEAELGEIEANANLGRHMLDELRLGDTYGELAGRARRKRELLQSLELPDPVPSDTGLTVLELRRWFFEVRISRRMPTDIDGFLQETGYPDRESFDRAVAREYIFWNRAANEATIPER